MKILRRTYCRKIGWQFMQSRARRRRAGSSSASRAKTRRCDLRSKASAPFSTSSSRPESFERFADVKYTGTKRFGLDGGESMIPALEQIIKRGGQLGVREIVIGHGASRPLDVLANVMSKPFRAIFNEFKGGSWKPDDVEGSGDVKYHLGASSDRQFDGNSVHLSLTANPSHLEIVDPWCSARSAREAGSARVRAG